MRPRALGKRLFRPFFRPFLLSRYRVVLRIVRGQTARDSSTFRGIEKFTKEEKTLHNHFVRTRRAKIKTLTRYLCLLRTKTQR